MKIRFANSMEIIAESGCAGFDQPSAQWNDVSVSQVMTERGMKVVLSAGETPVKYIKLRWKFTAEEKRNESVRVLSDAWERGYGDLEWRGIVTERNMPWVCAVSNGSDANPDMSGRFTECFGVAVRPNAFCMWNYDTHGVTLHIDVRNGASGVILGGRELDVCEILFGEYRAISAFSAVCAYYKTLCTDAIFPKHPVYGSNNWYYAYGVSSHEEILSDTDFVVARCGEQENIPYMVIDDGWQPNECDGPWHCGNEKFPDMKALADQMRAKGVRPGIWIRYLHDEVRYLNDPKGEQSGITEDMRLMRDPFYLDPTHPAAQALTVRDTKRIVEEWGYELIKHDFSTFDLFGEWGSTVKGFLAKEGDWHFLDRSKTSAEIVIDFYRLIKEAAGDCIILGCNVIGHLAAGLVEMNRTGDDTNGREWDRTRKMGVNTLAFRMPHHKAFYDVDADCVGVMGIIPWQLNREWLRALSVSGTPLFVSYDPKLPEDEQAYSDVATAFNRSAKQTDDFYPVDWMENTCPEKWMLNGEEVTFEWFM